MKNLKKLFFVLLLVCAMLVPSAVSAATKAKLVIDCGETTYDEKEEGVTCTVGLEIPSDETISFKTISFNLAKELVGEEATFEAFDDDISVSGNFGETFTITKKNNGVFSGTEELLVIKNVTMPGVDKAKYEKGQYNYVISLSNVKLVVDDKTSYTGAEAKTTIRLLSTDNTLSALTIDGVVPTSFSSNGSVSKFTTSNGKVKLSATASNQNAKISVNTGNEVAKEIKNKELSLPYGDTNIVITVTSESGLVKIYTIYTFRFYRLFPGYNFEFNSKNSTYTLNVGKDVTKFAICSYDEDKNAFVKKDDVLCINTGVLEDVFEVDSDTTYYKTLKLNGTYITADYASLSEKEKFDSMEIVNGPDGYQTLYKVFGSLKDGENTLTFSVDDLHPEYKVVINKGEKSDAITDDTVVKPTDKPGNTTDGVGGGSDDVSGNVGSSDNKPSTNPNVKDETVESPKTGIVTYTLIILAVAGLAGGAYWYLRKKNILKKI